MAFEPRISTTIMYAPWVGWRAENASEIASQLRASSYIDSVNLHEAANTDDIWSDARECWLDGDNVDSTHHIVVQGDAELCDGFGEAVYNAIRAVPNRVLGLYGNHQSMEPAVRDGKRWVRMNGGVWALCVCIPSTDVREMVEWCDYYFEDDYIHDDTMIGAWSQLEYPGDVWQAVPQLVEHRGADDSSIGHNVPTDFTAALYVEETDLSAPEIDWVGGSHAVPTITNHHRRPFPGTDGLRHDRLVEDGYIEEVDQ